MGPAVWASKLELNKREMAEIRRGERMQDYVDWGQQEIQRESACESEQSEEATRSRPAPGSANLQIGLINH